MKLATRHLAIATLALCPLLTFAQNEADVLPSAPSAVAAVAATPKHELIFNSATTFAEPSVSSRLNSSQKFSTFVEQSMSPYATFSSAITASFRPSWNNSQFSENYASRMGRSISDQTEQGFFSKFLLPSVLHQDPRYYQSDDPGTVQRTAYAVSRVLITRDDNGRATLNSSELLGAFIAASLSTAYHPYRRYTPGETAGRAMSGIGSDAGMNMLREFWPDIREHLMDHGPRVMQTLVTRFGPRVQPANPASTY